MFISQPAPSFPSFCLHILGNPSQSKCVGGVRAESSSFNCSCRWISLSFRNAANRPLLSSHRSRASSSCGTGWRGAAQEAYTERVEFSDVSAKDLYIRESACISDIQESATDISFYCGYIQADATGSWIRPSGSLYIQADATVDRGSGLTRSSYIQADATGSWVRPHTVR